MVGTQSQGGGKIEQHITNHFTINGNGDAALKRAMERLLKGSEMGLNWPDRK
jgi:hypothetical protein